MTTFNRGDQIAYVPTHARRYRSVSTGRGYTESGLDMTHPDIEFGFVTSQRGDTVFCRYWRKGQPGVLRTRANSEGTPIDCLVRHESVPGGDVWEAIQRIEAAEAAL